MTETKMAPRKWMLALALILAFSWLLVITYIARASLSYNVLGLPFESRAIRLIVRSFFPEGFGFFTRNPQEARLHLFEIVDDRIIPLSRPNAWIGHMFGVKRIGRARNIELGQLLNRLQQMPWRQCQHSLEECLAESWPANEIRNHHSKPLLCGDLVVQVKKPVPWAWHRDFKGYMPSEIIKVRVLCDG